MEGSLSTVKWSEVPKKVGGRGLNKIVKELNSQCNASPWSWTQRTGKRGDFNGEKKNYYNMRRGGR